jgi:hypothetical protein
MVTSSIEEAGVELIKDVAKPTAQSFGSALAPAGVELGQTAAGLIHVATSPFRPLVWGFQQVEDKLLPLVAEKINRIPEHRRKLPDANLVGATLEASKFHLASEEITDLFASLLASASDEAQSSKVHPAYIHIIQQLSPLDARCLTWLWEKHSSANGPTGKIAILNINTAIPRDGTVYPVIRDFNELIFHPDVEALPYSYREATRILENADRLGLLFRSYSTALANKGKKTPYDQLLYHPKLVDMANDVSKGGYKQQAIFGYAQFTEFGDRFFEVVRPKGERDTAEATSNNSDQGDNEQMQPEA